MKVSMKKNQSRMNTDEWAWCSRNMANSTFMSEEWAHTHIHIQRERERGREGKKLYESLSYTLGLFLTNSLLSIYFNSSDYH